MIRGVFHVDRRLLLVELWVLERRDSADLSDQRRWQTLLVHEEPLREGRVQAFRKEPAHRRSGHRPGRRSQPGSFVLSVVVIGDGPDTENRPGSRSVLDEGFDAMSFDAFDPLQQAPLVADGLPVCSDEHRVALAACLVLERQGDEVAEPTRRHRVLVGEQAVVGVERKSGVP